MTQNFFLPTRHQRRSQQLKRLEGYEKDYIEGSTVIWWIWHCRAFLAVSYSQVSKSNGEAIALQLHEYQISASGPPVQS